MNAPAPVAPRLLRLDPADNVAVAIDRVAAGRTVLGVQALRDIPRGHKMALVAIAPGEPVKKLGQPIGAAKMAIAPGDWVHEHNVGLIGPAGEHDFGSVVMELPLPMTPPTFQGYRRASGKSGTRNYVGILTSVNCSASVARFAAEEVRRAGLLEQFPGIDGIVPIVHGTGCGMAARGEGFEILQRTLWGYAAHPNFAAVMMVGLGCEVFQIGAMKERTGLEESDRFRSLTIQESGGTRKTVETIVAAMREMLPAAAAAKRETRPASELVLGLQCGGSDGYSALTANPALGAASDLLVAAGGTSILSETPEIYGAEHLLTRRAKSPEIGEKLLSRLRWWEDYTQRNGGEMNNNPSPGNKAGGLTTILEKSLGAVAKSGRAALSGVIEYAERVDRPGLIFMDTPGYDPVSATGQVAGGATLIAFTTGRGSAFGCKPAPSLKLSTTSELYARMQDDMDIDCGPVLDGVTVEEKGREIFTTLLEVASGSPTRSERLGYGDLEFVPWQVGAVM